MNDVFSRLDYSDADDALNPVATLLCECDFGELYNSFLPQAIKSWSDTLSPEQRTHLADCIRQWLEDGSSRDPASLLHYFDDSIKELFDSFPKELRLRPLDSSFPLTLSQECEYGIKNEALKNKPFDRYWIRLYISWNPQLVLPVLLEKQPKEVAVLYSITKTDDIKELLKLKSLLLKPKQQGCIIDRDDWLRDLETELVDQLAGLKHDSEKFQSLLETFPEWSKFFTFRLDRIANLLMDALPSSLELDQVSDNSLLALVHCSLKTNRWEDLPEALRIGIFVRFVDVDFLYGPNSKSYSKFIPFLRNNENENQIKHPLFWLNRNDSNAYTAKLLDRIDRLGEKNKLTSVKCILNEIKDLKLEADHIKSAVKGVIEQTIRQPARMDIDALALLLNSKEFDGFYDRSALEKVHLGRIRQCMTDYFSRRLPDLFGNAYKSALKSEPLDVLTRLLNAAVSSQIELCDEGLEARNGNNYLFGQLPNLGQRIDHKESIPGSWLMCRILEWVINIIPDLLRDEQSRHKGISGTELKKLSIPEIRRTWATFSWGKLDLKKGSKGKKDLENSDFIEPRAEWRIAHLNTLSDLGDDLGNKAHRRIYKIAETDPSPEVREVASRIYHQVLRERKATEPNPLIAFLKATLWLRIANRTSLRLPIDESAAKRARNREIRAAKEEFDYIQSAQV